MKAIKSTDPRKPTIVAALKAKSGGTKVTNVREHNGVYLGDCLRHAGKVDSYGRRTRDYEAIGTFEVTL